jgi:hypothetical protein
MLMDYRRGVALAWPIVALVGGLAGCGDDAESEPGAPVEVALADLCGDPDAYDGRTVIVRAPVQTSGMGTAAGCEPQCCNQVHYDMGFGCGSEPFTQWDPTSIALVPDEGDDWPEVHGEVVEPDETWQELELLIEDSHTRFGCVGQECYSVCTPADPEDIAVVTGVFRLGTNDILANPYGGATYERTITVTSIELQDGTRLP